MTFKKELNSSDNSNMTGGFVNFEYKVENIEIEKLLPTEFHDHKRVDSLFQSVQESCVWKKPILVEKNSLAIMDGHHRREVALRLGLKLVPVIKLEYSDARVTLSSWRTDHFFYSEDIIHAALTGKLFPIKTTRHQLSVPLPDISVPLKELMYIGE